MPSRSGFQECYLEDQELIRRWVVFFAGVKQAAELFSRRPRRFVLVSDDSKAVPLKSGTKRIHFVRHGQGFHNIWRAGERTAGRVPRAKRGNFHSVPKELYDPDLTANGKAEAAAAQACAKAVAPQLLVTSPVRRAVQTLLIVFKDAIENGVPALAHELCREQFRGLDPSIYDARRGRSALSHEFPQIDFNQYVLPEEVGSNSSTDAESSALDANPAKELAVDPMWWLCGSPLGNCEGGPNEATMVEHAYGFLSWLMSRPESEIGVATHSFFLLALFYGALDVPGRGVNDEPDLFYTGEFRSILVQEVPAPQGHGGAALAAYGEALLGGGLRVSEQTTEAQSAKRTRSN